MEVGSAFNYEQLLDGAKQQALDKIGGDKLQKISTLLGQAGLVNAELNNFGFYKTLGNMFKESAKEAMAEFNKPATPLGTEGTGMKDFQPMVETQTSPQVEEISKGIFGRQILGDKPVATPTEAPTQAPRTTSSQAPAREPLFPEEAPARPPLQGARPPVPLAEDPELQRLTNLRDQYTQGFNETKTALQGQQNAIESDFQNFAQEIYEKTGNILNPEDTDFAGERDQLIRKGQLAQEGYEGDLADINAKITDREKSLRAINQEPPSIERSMSDPLQRQAEVEPSVSAQRSQSARPFEGQPEDVVNQRQTVPTETETNFGDLLDGAKANLASDVEGMTQSIKGSLFGRASQYYDKAVNYKQSLEAGIDKIQSLRNKATDYAQSLKSQAGDIESQGRSYIKQGQDALARGETAGQDLVNQGQGLLNKSLEQGMNAELFQTAMDTAQDKITRGQSLLNNGDQTGMKLLQDGQDQLEQAQSLIKGYGGQARQFGQQIQTEIEGRTQQLNDLAEGLISKTKTATNAMSDIGNAVKSGDIQGAVEGTQNLVKTAGQLAEKGGIAGGEELGATLSEAIPVVGEVLSAGLLIASLFTGFTPHEQAPSITTATQAFGV
jgi:hypothetical protein